MIRDNIKRICHEKNRTVSDLEHKVGMSKGYIYNMKNPTYNLLKGIADELKVDVCELISEQDS